MPTFNFPITSRYYGIPTTTLLAPDGRSIVYLTRRFLPDPSRFALLQYYTVTEGERPDNVAARFLSFPDGAWRIADANGVMRPEELTKPVGRQVRITLPEGIPGASNA